VSLRRSPTRTLAFLAANRRNALKSTGPRTVAGKARSSLNALKHGQRAQVLEEKLLAARDWEGVALRRQFWQEIREGLGLFQNRKEERQAERLANGVYAHARRVGKIRTKPECPLFSARLGPRLPLLFPFRIEDPRNLLILVYWVQRRGFWTLMKMLDGMFRPGAVQEPPLGRMLESRLRHRVFRMRRPGLWERQAYGLDDRGMPDPAQRVRRDLLWMGGRKFDGRWWREKPVAR
jgi:hypothetical protein